MKWTALTLGALFVLALIVPNVLEEFVYSGSDGGRHKCRSDLRQIANALDEYATRNDGRYPVDLAELIEADAEGYRYLSITRVPRDPWKSVYVYVTPRVLGERPGVYSLGQDGKAGTDDDIRPVDE